FASGIMDAGSYRWLLRDVPIVHFDYTWRYFVDPDRVTTEQAPNLAVDVDKLGAVDAVVLTGFPTLVDGHLRQRSLAASLVATSVAGFLTVSILAGFVLASLAARRQISSMSLLINRGVRRRTILAVGWLHGLVAALPAAAAGLLVARWLEPRGRWPLAVSIAGLIAVAVAVVVVGAVRASSLVAADGTIANPQFADRSGTADDWFSDRWQTTGVRRMVRDVTIIGLAGAAIVLVRRRLEQGQAIVGSSGSLVQDLDGLVAALPSLVAIASGIVLLRLAGPLYRILAAGGSRSRGLALFVGLRRLINQDRATRTAMTVVLVAVAVTGLASTLVETVGGGQYEHSRQQAAADLVVRGPADGVPLPTPVVEFNPIDPVAVAQAVERPGTIVVQPLGAPPVYVVAIDSGPMARVQGDGVINPAALEALAAADDTVRGLPALVAGRWDADVRPVIDSILELQVGTARVATTVVGRVDRFPSTPPDHPIVVVDLERLREALGPAVPPITTLFVDLDGAVDASEVARSITNLAPGLRVVDRQEVLRSFGGDPFVRWTLLGLRLLGWLSLLTGVLALWAALAITAPERRRNTGLLSVMGLRPGQAVALSTIEQVVPFAMAAVAGVATAAGLIGLLGFGFDLGPFTGDLPAIPLRADLWSLAIPAAIIVMAAAGAVAFGEGRRRWRGTEPASAATVGVAARGGGP
ncbi:MAG: hypothetical protein OER95_15735, partial [Acidimicrobiia bacterium]|nr:hypothetical protein [Acidimicrobiia bacterium]